MPDELDTSTQVAGQPCVSACDSTSSASSKLTAPNIDAAAHFDLVIIGAGPAALAVISRILESRPAALYTEDEHRHLHFTHNKQRTPALIPSKVAKTSASSRESISRELEQQNRLSRKKKGKGIWNLDRDELCPCDGRIKILVIDRLGEGFMGLWRRNFRALGISHLRSPMFFHPDASDFDALIAYANEQGKAGEGTPEQVIELIEKRIGTGSSTAVPCSRGGRRRSKARRSPSPVESEHESANHRRGLDEASLPDLIEILGVVGKEKSKHKRKQQQLQPKEHHTSAIAATNTKVHVNERDRRDYFTPSSSLFDAFTRRLEHKYQVKSCDNGCTSTWPTVSEFFDGESEEATVVDVASVETGGRGGLEESPVTTLKGRVKELVWFDGGKRTVQDDFGNHHPGFLLEVDGGDASKASQDSSVVISAKAVVSAVGFGGMPMIPPYLLSSSPCQQTATTPTSEPTPAPSPSPPPACGPGWMHSGCLAAQSFPIPPALPPLGTPRERRMVVVGGGLTSAQIVVRALEHGFDKVTLLIRGHLKSKPFDVDLGWVGRYSNYLKMQFWQNEDVQERLTTLRAARNGGSVTPTYAKLLARLQALGKVEIRTHTTISSATYASTTFLDRAVVPQGGREDQGDRGSADAHDARGTEPSEESTMLDDLTDPDRQWTLELRTSTDGGKLEQLRADYLIVATGAQVDFGSLPFLTNVQKTHPIRLVGGMPVLTADLEYRRDVPLFVTGAYAGLQIGPAAGNLGGMRDSADRIANRLLELLSLPEGLVPNVLSLPETVVPKTKHVQNSVSSEENADKTPPTKARKTRPVPERAPFTHFNFDLLSIEA